MKQSKSESERLVRGISGNAARFKPEVLEKLQGIQEKNGCTMSWLIRRAVDRYLESLERGAKI